MSGTEDKAKRKSHEIKGKGKGKVGKLTWEGEAIETHSSMPLWRTGADGSATFKAALCERHTGKPQHSVQQRHR